MKRQPPDLLRIPVIAFTLFLLVASPWESPAADRIRTELQFPDVPGYVTLKCDFHMHTVFSDGTLWPSLRPEEAWRDGLDAIAITDHIEYQPHRSDVSTNYERSYELARAAGAPLGIIVIRAAEITRGEPPGHLNAVFLKSIAPLRTDDYRVAVKAAVDQGAFLFWNHPGWKQPGHKSVWYTEQGEFHEKGWLHGIEVVNGSDYDPIAHQWCVDKKLALIGNSDAHGPIAWDYDPAQAEHRPLTLVFARERTEAAIREALLARRTVLFNQQTLYGEAQFLEALFTGSLEVKSQPVGLRGKSRTWVQVFNRSPVNFELERRDGLKEASTSPKITLRAGKTSLVELTATGGLSGERTLALPFRVTNLKTGPNQALDTDLKVKVEFVR